MLPWITEVYVSSWHNKPVVLALPAKEPAESLVELTCTGKDTFRRLGDDGELGEAYEFECDDDGFIQRIKRHNNYFTRIPD